MDPRERAAAEAAAQMTVAEFCAEEQQLQRRPSLRRRLHSLRGRRARRRRRRRQGAPELRRGGKFIDIANYAAYSLSEG